MILEFDKKIGPLSLLKGLLFQLGGIQGDTQWQLMARFNSTLLKWKE